MVKIKKNLEIGSNFIKKNYDYVLVFVFVSLLNILELVWRYYADIYPKIPCFFARFRELILGGVQYKLLPFTLYSAKNGLIEGIIDFMVVIGFSYIIFFGTYYLLKRLYTKIENRNVKLALIILFCVLLGLFLLSVYIGCNISFG